MTGWIIAGCVVAVLIVAGSVEVSARWSRQEEDDVFIEDVFNVDEPTGREQNDGEQGKMPPTKGWHRYSCRNR